MSEGQILQQNQGQTVVVEEPVSREPVGYVWPKVDEESKSRVIVGGDAVVRVVKVTSADPAKRFWNGPYGKTVHIGQWRVPMADGKFDIDRLYMELRRNKLMLIEEAFPDEIIHPCEVNNCWKPSVDGSFCCNRHRDAALTAHERYLKFD